MVSVFWNTAHDGVRRCLQLGRTPKPDRPGGFSRWQSTAQSDDVFKHGLWQGVILLIKSRDETNLLAKH